MSRNTNRNRRRVNRVQSAKKKPDQNVPEETEVVVTEVIVETNPSDEDLTKTEQAIGELIENDNTPEVTTVIPELKSETPVFGDDFYEEDEPIEDVLEAYSEGEEVATTNPSDYFEDDELILKSDDKLLLGNNDLNIFQQLDNVVSYEITNFWNDEDKPRKKSELRNDPPVFKISSSNGDVAQFILTRELSGSLAKAFDTVYKGYFGVDGRKESKAFSQESFKDGTNDIKKWVQDNKGKTIFFAALVLFVLINAFILH